MAFGTRIANCRHMKAELTIEDCKHAIHHLKNRLKKADDTMVVRDTSFLELPIEELGFTHRSRSQLKKHNVAIVRDITDIGVEHLINLKGIGDGTIKEIKRLVYNAV